MNGTTCSPGLSILWCDALMSTTSSNCCRLAIALPFVMSPTGTVVLRLAIALGIGLLIGAERERCKGKGASRSPAGIRTFAVTCLLGGVSLQPGGEVLLAVATLAIAALVAIAYVRTNACDPGLTTEAALLLTLLLSGLTTGQPALASGLAVTLAVLLAWRAAAAWIADRAGSVPLTRWPAPAGPATSATPATTASPWPLPASCARRRSPRNWGERRGRGIPPSTECRFLPPPARL
jgi:hypothetical protein